MSQVIKVGDLVNRNGLMFMVIEIGDCYQEGFVRCRSVGKRPIDYWILATLLEHW